MSREGFENRQRKALSKTEKQLDDYHSLQFFIKDKRLSYLLS